MPGTFNYTSPVTGKMHIGRAADTAILGNLLHQGENVVIYEPAKTGKHSLVQQTFLNMKIAGEQFIAAQISLLNVRDVTSLLLKLGSVVIRTYASTPLEYEEAVSCYLEGTHFVFDREAFSRTDMVLSLNWDIDDNDIRAILELPYKLSAGDSNRLIIVLDEFQNIMLSDDGEHFCRIVESVFKSSPEGKCSFLMLGSAYNAMKEIFEVRGFFFRHVTRVEMNEISDKEISDHMTRFFLTSGKVMERDLLLSVCRLFRNNVWYVTYFCSVCDSLSRGYIVESTCQEALRDIIAIHEPRFVSMMNDLTNFQVSLLRAILEGNVKFSSAEVIRKYELNSSANVRRLKDALSKKEIVTFGKDDEPRLLDPLFEYWAKKYFFLIPE